MDFIKDMMSGFIGGVCCTFAGLPLDLVKVRQQTIFKNKSLSGAFYHTIYNEGILALWKGSLPALSSILTENAVVFAANGVIKRVVMDYSEFCKIYKYEDYDKFLNKNKKRRIVLMTTKAKKNYHRFIFKKNDILLFGRESAGVPDSLHKTIKDKVKVPMNKRTRSLNVAMSVAIISAEALRQNNLLK